MQVQRLGHVVFYVRSMARSVAFYRDLLGFQEVAQGWDGRAMALTGGSTHHEMLLIEVGDAPGPPSGRRIGLYHIGLKIGETLDALKAAKTELETAGVPIEGVSDHDVSKSLYVRDPDGNEVELYIDDPSVDWRTDPERVMHVGPLRL